jgi:hypothetical protein
MEYILKLAATGVLLAMAMFALVFIGAGCLYWINEIKKEWGKSK